MGKKDERIRDLLHIIGKRNGVTIKDLAAIKGVSELTIRRDIQRLEEQQLVNNVRGTVFCSYEEHPDDSAANYLLSDAANEHRKEKKRIGEYAAKLIRPGEFIVLDNGSTTEQLAASIPDHAELTALCYNLNVLNHLYRKPGVNLILCGGNFHHQTLMFECAESLDIIRRTRASKVFVSAAGIHETLGVTVSDEYELACKREILKTGVERILLADSSKFGRVEPCCFGELSMFEKIITDTGLSPEWAEQIRSRGIELTLV